MTSYNIVNPTALVTGQPEDISVILSNLQAIQSVLNGNVDDGNIKAAAAIAIAKLANYPADATRYLRGDGTWVVPPSPVVTAYTSPVVSGANTDISFTPGATSFINIGTGGGSIRSISAPATSGSRLTIRNIGAAITLLHATAGGSGAQLFIINSGNKILPFNGTIEMMYDGTYWIEVNRPAKELIQTITLGSNGAISFQNIPACYTHLEIVGNIRSSYTGSTVDNINIRFNNDSGPNYLSQIVGGVGASAVGNFTTNLAAMTGVPGTLADILADNASPVYFSPFTAVIPNYTNTSINRTAMWWTGQSISRAVEMLVGWWANGTAVNRVDFLSTNGASNSLKTGSQLSLYGIT